LPKMAQAARNPKLREAFDKHLVQTQHHVERLKKAFGCWARKRRRLSARPCKAWLRRDRSELRMARRWKM
jgi:ferritin-like metal-binding protein YciE